MEVSWYAHDMGKLVASTVNNMEIFDGGTEDLFLAGNFNSIVLRKIMPRQETFTLTLHS